VIKSADANCQATVSADAFNNFSSDPDGDTLSFSVSPAGPYGLGVTNVVLTVTDGHGGSSTCNATVTVEDKTDPLISCPGDITVNNDPGVCGAVVTFAAPVGTDNCPGATTAQTAGLASGALFPVGTTVNTFKVTDGAGHMAECSFKVTVVDNEYPTITCPADVTVHANNQGGCTAVVNGIGPVSAGDNCPNPTIAYSLSGDTTGSGADNASGTAFNLGTTTVKYTITDAVGLKTDCSFKVNVLNDPPVVTMTGPANTVYAVNTPVSFTGTFTDADGGPHTGTWMFDNISQAATIVEPSAGNSYVGSANASYTFTAAGVYTVKLTVTDSCGAIGTATTKDSVEFLIVVYDPSAGFVTGGGWINSPAGAYAANPSLTGKATFGFVSKYLKGANKPTGETEFQFQVANFDFHSSVYDWLVVSGALAQYKGTGTINGSSGTMGYGFILTATDGQVNGGGGVDKFRIKIWDKATSVVIYDNAMGSSDDINTANPQVIGGGSIVIHK
jgi:hypothetical protein